MIYLELTRQLIRFFSTTDLQQFIQIFGDNTGTHLWRKYGDIFSRNRITLGEVHRFLANLDLDNERKLEAYLSPQHQD